MVNANKVLRWNVQPGAAFGESMFIASQFVSSTHLLFMGYKPQIVLFFWGTTLEIQLVA
jgi:hypothetical protein